jgi:hypothetical protein
LDTATLGRGVRSITAGRWIIDAIAFADVHRQHVVDVESDVGALDRQAVARQRERRDDEEQRDRDLARDQRRAHPGAAASAAAVRAEIADERRARRLERRNQCERQRRGRCRGQREEEHAVIDRERCRAQDRRERRRQRAEENRGRHAEAGRGQREGGARGEKRHQHRLGHELPDDPPAARPSDSRTAISRRRAAVRAP